MKLTRYKGNPILTPTPERLWESFCVCNPGAWYENGTVTMLYRAAPDTDEHPIYFGLARSRDGFSFERVSEEPVFGPMEGAFDGGCVEDARIVKLDGVFYVTYAARMFPPGAYYRNTISLTHFVPEPFRHESAPKAMKWNLTRSGLAATTDFRAWTRLGPITAPDVDDRDVILFPEPIQGRYWRMHRPSEWVGDAYGCDRPSIWISSSGDMLKWDSSEILAQPAFEWEGKKIGGGTPPIRTDRGWLTLYHGVCRDHIYRAGALLLDLEDPRMIIGRSPEPILEPEEDYELRGMFPNVVFPTGNVVIDGTLFVYYGCADKVIGAATVPLEAFVDYLADNPPAG